MGLIAWYPLNGNTNDYSGNNYNATNSGATINENGKIGQCYSFTQTGSDGINITTKNFTELKDSYSMAIWVNPAGTHYHYNGTFISSGNWNGSNWAFGLSQDNTQIDVLGHGYNKWISYTVPLNTWTHISCVVSNNISKVYINSNYIGSVAVTSALASDATNTFIGRETYANGYFSFNGKLNDLRIYDHALSEKEIKEIAKAKILHYTFDDFQEPATNIISTDFDSTFESYTDGNNVSFYNQLGTNNYLGTSTNGYNSLKSLKVNRGVGGNGRIYKTKNINLGDYISISAMVYSTSPGPYLHIEYSGGDYSWSVAYTKNIHTGKGWEQLYASVAVAATSATTLYYFYYPVNENLDTYIDNIQIEKKPYYTPYTPTLRSGIINDNSGFRNNATLAEATTPRWTSDSKIGSGAYKFNGLNNYITTSILYETPTITISLWFKTNILHSGNLYWGTGTNKIILRTNPDGTLSWYIGTSTTAAGYFNSNSIYSIGVWNHIVVQYDGANIYAYFNGVKQSTISAVTGSVISSSLNIGTNYNTSGAWFNGVIDDVKIYANPLSDSDVLELYQTRASVDSSGNLFLTELDYEEYANSQISKQGVLKYNNISEVGITDGLVAYYPLDKDARDYSENGNHGTVSGAVLGGGVKSGAYNFDGVDDYISFPEIVSNANIRASGVTYSAWIKLDTIKESRVVGQQPYNGYSDYASGGIGVSSVGKALSICYDENINYKYVTGTTTLQTGTWYHIVSTYSSSDKYLRLYVNGTKEGLDSLITTFNVITANNSNRIGLKDHATPYPTDGLIDEVRIYNRALTQEEVSILYETTAPTTAAMKITKDTVYLKGEFKEVI